MSIDYNLIGRRIKKYRKANQKTQEQLAEYLSVSSGYVSQIERGTTKVSLDTLSNIAAFLCCDVTQLIVHTTKSTERYLYEEFGSLFCRLNDRQKKLLIEIMAVILEFK